MRTRGREENVRFIVLETIGIVGATRQFLDTSDPVLHDAIVRRDDYIDNLKSTIGEQGYLELHTRPDLAKEEIDAIRATDTICINLERIADHCVNITRQWGYLEDPGFLTRFEYDNAFRQVEAALGKITSTLESRDLSAALQICKTEDELDQLYKTTFEDIMTEMYGGRNIQNLLTTLFIFRYLERMGDALLNIGEALIFAIMGEKIKIRHFEALRRTLDKSGFEGSMKEIDFESIWGTRSGCRIGRVGSQRPGGGDARSSIFKEGDRMKIAAERKNLEYWQQRFPGLTPRVISYHEQSSNASLLVEFLPGETLEEIILGDDRKVLEEALGTLLATLRRLWTASRRAEVFPTDYVGQMVKRMEEVHRLHPELSRDERLLGGARVSSTSELIRTCRTAEGHLLAPATVRIHGDFNTNNVLYDTENDHVYFIDLYRSREYDYVQDVSVFLISNFRVPVLERKARQRLSQTIRIFYEFAASMAADWGDETFAARLALALARSFYTSIRFELNIEFAKEMYLRAHYLLDSLGRHVQAGRPWPEYRLRQEILYL